VFNAGGKHHIVLGVLNVEKHSKGELYTHNDLQTMRHIVLRFCLWRAHLLNQLCNRSLAQLTGQAETSIEEKLPPTDRPELPPYVMAVKEQVQRVIENLHLLTQSTVVTVRLLTRDGQHIVWFVSSAKYTAPQYKTLLERCHSSIPLGQAKHVRSINAWVAWYGRECYVPDLRALRPRPDGEAPYLAPYRRLEGFLESHPDVRSEYCLPIILGGRVYGTLDLESVHPDAYSEHRPFIQAIADQIGLAFAQLRRRTEQPIFSLSSKLVLNSHGLMQCRDQLLTQAKLSRNGAAADTANALERIARAVEECLGLGELAPAPPPGGVLRRQPGGSVRPDRQGDG
jgi:hypothetical protein